MTWPARQIEGRDGRAAATAAVAAVFLATLWYSLREAVVRARGELEVRESQLGRLAELQQLSGRVEELASPDLQAVRGMFVNTHVVWARDGDATFVTFEHDARLAGEVAAAMPFAR